MSSSTIGLFLLMSTGPLVFAVCAVASGCSDDTTPAGNRADAAAPSTSDASQKDAPPEEAGPPPSRAACIADCATTYPSAKAKDDAITTCWMTNCAGRCTDDPVDAGIFDDVGDGGTCQNPVTTQNLACDLCTQAHCCAPWDGCFNDTECTKFVHCTSGCPAD